MKRPPPENPVGGLLLFCEKGRADIAARPLVISQSSVVIFLDRDDRRTRQLAFAIREGGVGMLDADEMGALVGRPGLAGDFGTLRAVRKRSIRPVTGSPASIWLLP